MSTLTLFEAANELAPLLDQIDEDGVISPELEAALSKFENKGQAVVAYILNMEANAEMILSASKAMAARAGPLQKRADSLRAYLMVNMKITGMTHIKALDGSFEAKLQLERDASVDVFDIDQVPRDYFIDPPKPALVVSKTLIRKAMEDGFEVPGARIVKKDRLTIKP